LRANANELDWRRGMERLWLQWIGSAGPSRAVPVVWAPHPEAGEIFFWQGLVYDAERLVDRLIIVDAGATPSRYLAALPAIKDLSGPIGDGVHVLRLDPATISLSQAKERAAAFSESLGRIPIFLRLSGPIMEPAATLARAFAPPLLLVSADSAPLEFWNEQAALLKATVAPPDGLAVWNEPNWFS
jgi:hypothetical protein